MHGMTAYEFVHSFSIFCDVLFIVSHIGFMYGIKLTLHEVDLYGKCREIYQSRVL